MGIRQFEDILSWQKAKDLTVYIYNLFKVNRDYGFRDQFQRASISIMNNIAEGFERKGYREFSRFLYIAKGSAGEVRSMSHIGMEIGYLNNDEYIYIRQTVEEISRLLIRTDQGNREQGKMNKTSNNGIIHLLFSIFYLVPFP